ncbi:MAG: hypothetical protein JSW33_11800 [bacterium]|nr:MAG: hypothetical protein JSW33_11800 [bacterium]
MTSFDRIYTMKRIKNYFQNLSTRRGYILFIIFLVVYLSILYFTAGLHQPVWGDERHFVQTVHEFGQELSLAQLKSYNEMSTPLPFILYALWGKISGYELQQLRLFSLIIAFLTFLIFFRLYQDSSKHLGLALLITLFLIFQPYMIGISVFVFTDMLPLLFLGLSVWAFHRDNPFLMGVALGGALLCRQYYLFLPVAFAAYYSLRILMRQTGSGVKMLFAIALSGIPLILLFILWGGFSPQNDMRKLYLHEKLYFHTDYLILYIALFLVYLFPLILYRWKKFYLKKNILLAALVLSGSYFLFPVKASAYSMAIEIYTVGFFHKFVRLTIGSSLEHYVFYLSYLLSLPVLLTLLIDIYGKVKNRTPDGLLMVNLCIVFFLLIMPFSYLNWEKYFLPVIPLAIISILNKDKFKFLDLSPKSAEN